MADSKLKAQVVLEFSFIFIIILLFFLGVFKIWLDLNAQYIQNVRDFITIKN